MTLPSCLKTLAALFAFIALLTPAWADQACFNACMAPRTRPDSTPVPGNPQVCLQACGYRPSVDYKCVQQCSAGGTGAGATCPAQCSYYPEDLLNRLGKPVGLSPHNQFVAPEPMPGVLLDPPSPAPASTPKTRLSPTTQPLSPSLNYKTLSLCLQNGYSYSYCRGAAEY